MNQPVELPLDWETRAALWSRRPRVAPGWRIAEMLGKTDGRIADLQRKIIVFCNRPVTPKEEAKFRKLLNELGAGVAEWLSKHPLWCERCRW